MPHWLPTNQSVLENWLQGESQQRNWLRSLRTWQTQWWHPAVLVVGQTVLQLGRLFVPLFGGEMPSFWLCWTWFPLISRVRKDFLSHGRAQVILQVIGRFMSVWDNMRQQWSRAWFGKLLSCWITGYRVHLSTIWLDCRIISVSQKCQGVWIRGWHYPRHLDHTLEVWHWGGNCKLKMGHWCRHA